MAEIDANDRVTVKVTPDLRKFLPELRKGLQRVQRQVEASIRVLPDMSEFRAKVTAATRAMPPAKVPVEPDTDGFDRQTRRTTERMRPVALPVTPDLDQFRRAAAADVRKALAGLEASLPLTADGERVRRQATALAVDVQRQLEALRVKMPVGVEESARARRELRASIEELQAIAKASPVEIPVRVDTSMMDRLRASLPGATSGLAGVANPMAIVTGVVLAVAAVGSLLSALPALMASIAAPIGVIALGWDGISKAAQRAKPAFDAMRGALSVTFYKRLTPVFDTLAGLLPKITPSLQVLAEELSGMFQQIADALASPTGVKLLNDIFRSVAEAIKLLTPLIGPMTTAFLEFARTGMDALVKTAPDLIALLRDLGDIFQRMNDSGMLGLAVEGFALFVSAIVVLLAVIGGIGAALSIAVGAIYHFAMMVGTVIGKFVGGVVMLFRKAVESAVGFLSGLPSRASAAISSLPRLLGGIAGMAVRALVAAFLAGPAAVAAALSGVAARAVAALDGLPGSLVGIGRAAISGLISGMLGMVRSLMATAASIASRVASTIAGALRVNSPSRVTMEIGRHVGEGLALGMDSTARRVSASAKSLAGAAVPEPFGASGPDGGNPLDGARLRLGPVDPITREVAATLLTAHSRSV